MNRCAVPFICSIMLLGAGCLPTSKIASPPPSPSEEATTTSENWMPKGRIIAAPMRVTSRAVGEDKRMNTVHTCLGTDTAPEVTVSGTPSAAKSLVLLMEDLSVPKSNAPGDHLGHWVVFGLPPTNGVIDPRLGTTGKNDFGMLGYKGPCPPEGPHDYRLSVYALDIASSLPPGSTKEDVMVQMKTHLLGGGTLDFSFGRP